MAAGSFVAVMQSVGAAGLSYTSTAALASAGAATGGTAATALRNVTCTSLDSAKGAVTKAVRKANDATRTFLWGSKL